MRGSRLLVRTPSHEPAEEECSESEPGYTGAGGGPGTAYGLPDRHAQYQKQAVLSASLTVRGQQMEASDF
jgi:hypothetical protein